jgi:dTDP-4-amino-4,6-dideoxygalactose transaminase
MRENIPVARPWLGEEEAAAARRAILSGWVTQGPEVTAFEREFAALVGARYACAVSNCTTALHLALRAVGVKRGDEVITVSHSYIATANAIRYCGAVPVFIDVEPDTFNIDARLIAPAITPRTRAILCVHQIGMPCDLRELTAISRRWALPLIEDAACAVGSEIEYGHEWQKIGKPHGDIACFSFHPRKLITTGDGGMLTTSDPEWDQCFRRWRQHSMSVPDSIRHGAAEVIFEAYPDLGYNYRMTDIQAAVGREQLKRLPLIIERRRLLAERYRRLLEICPEVECPMEPKWARSNWQSYSVGLPAGSDQKAIMQFLLNRGIATRRGIMCSHIEPAYKKPGTCRMATRLAHSESAQNRRIVLPLYHQMTEQDQDRIVDALIEAIRQTSSLLATPFAAASSVH